jgi:hypothetical protein
MDTFKNPPQNVIARRRRACPEQSEGTKQSIVYLFSGLLPASFFAVAMTEKYSF